MQTSIIAIGTANPPHRNHQSNVVDIMCDALQLNPKNARILKSLFRSSGIEYRHSVISDYTKSREEFEFFPKDASELFPSTEKRMKIYEKAALPLSLMAIENCLKQIPNFNIDAITHLITVSCTGMYAPGLDLEIIHHLNLSPLIRRTNINFMGCYAAFNGLRTADALCKADPTAKVLVICVELCTLHFQKDNSMDSLFSNSIFADGAAAVIVEANSNYNKRFNCSDFHCDIVPETSREMAWYVGDHGFKMILTSYVSQAIEFGIAEFAKRLLTKKKYDLSHIDFFAIHPGGIKILQACEKALGISVNDNQYSYQILRDYGNMSSATVLFVLKAIWDKISSNDHQKNIFSCAFGPGLTLESVLLQTHIQ